MDKMSDKDLLDLCMKLNKKHVNKLDRMDKQITRLKTDSKRLVEALEGAYFLIKSVTSSRKGSIGSIHNTYLPQLKRKTVDCTLQEVNAALEAHEEVMNERT